MRGRDGVITRYRIPAQKVCPACGKSKHCSLATSRSAFSIRRDYQARSARIPPYFLVSPASKCKDCFARYMRAIRSTDKEKAARRVKNRLYRATHPEAEQRRQDMRAAPTRSNHDRAARERAQRRAMTAQRNLRERAPLVLDAVAAYYEISVAALCDPGPQFTGSEENYAKEGRMVAASLLGRTFGNVRLTDTAALLHLHHTTVLYHQKRLRKGLGPAVERTAKSACLATVKRWAKEQRPPSADSLAQLSALREFSSRRHHSSDEAVTAPSEERISESWAPS